MARVAQDLGLCGAQILAVAAATASSVQQNHFLASWAVDGNLSTRWSSNQGMPQWLQLDMGQRVFISQLNIDWQTAFAPKFRIEASDDASSFATVNINGATQAGWQDITGLNITARYLRIVGDQATNFGNISIVETQVIGDTNTACGTTETTCGESVKLTPSSAQASSQQFSYTPASAAIDGVYSTRWSSNFTDNEWLAMDLGSKARVDSLRITWEHAYAAQYSVQSGTSITGPWTTLATVNGQFGPQTVPNLNATTQFLRILGIDRATGYGYSIWDTDVYGSRDLSCVNLLKGPWVFESADITPSNVFTINGDSIAFAYDGMSFSFGPTGFTGLHFTQPVSVVQGGNYSLTLNVTNTSSVLPTLWNATLSGAGAATNAPPTGQPFEVDGTGSVTLTFVASSAPGSAPIVDLLNTPLLAGTCPGCNSGVGLNNFSVSATLTKTN